MSDRMPKKTYERELKRLQAQLVDMQAWVQSTGARIVVIFEGRDAAGKDRRSAGSRSTSILGSRASWRFRRRPSARRASGTFSATSPTSAAGEIVLMDRSWYNRAGVEHVMGYCTNAEYHRFLHQVPIFERMLVEDGILLKKYWFSVSDVEQEKRFRSRNDDPMRRWKLSPTTSCRSPSGRTTRARRTPCSCTPTSPSRRGSRSTTRTSVAAAST
jgi:polyphosphate kinase 2 (PPK2 family)